MYLTLPVQAANLIHASMKEHATLTLMEMDTHANVPKDLLVLTALIQVCEGGSETPLRNSHSKILLSRIEATFS